MFSNEFFEQNLINNHKLKCLKTSQDCFFYICTNFPPRNAKKRIIKSYVRLENSSLDLFNKLREMQQFL